MAQTARPLVTLVCTANVCRSVYAAALLSTGASALPADVTSAGVSAHPRLATCPLVLERLTSRDLPVSSAPPRPLEAELVASSALVLTMTAEQRGEAGRIAPAARQHVFTLIEATALAEALLERLEGRPTFSEWVTALGGLRGRVQLPVTPVRVGRWPRRHVEHVPDIGIPDGHTSDRTVDHLNALRSVEEYTGRLAAAALRALGGPHPQENR
ncbi:hypothetical protein [Propioniciclava soli]|uniref:arsenate reductase/protein-tyrosine-phosphatase family protein n=1 Tax=Propioniciclava soli TaxID=2775081 RepID=UPI001E42D1B4|nr:hypothetical protein [Propioniciclava soli]